jgi:hypothetical protein
MGPPLAWSVGCTSSIGQRDQSQNLSRAIEITEVALMDVVLNWTARVGGEAALCHARGVTTAPFYAPQVRPFLRGAQQLGNFSGIAEKIRKEVKAVSRLPISKMQCYWVSGTYGDSAVIPEYKCADPTWMTGSTAYSGYWSMLLRSFALITLNRGSPFFESVWNEPER